MQPTYLPWLGYFALIASADVFVFLDTVQFDRRSWQQRNRIKGPQGAVWLTIPVIAKGRADQKIIDVVIDPASNFADKHIASLRHAYGKAPHFDAWSEMLFGHIAHGHARLADLDIALIEEIAGGLGFAPRFVRASTLSATGAKDGLLAAICAELDADRYLSPAGSAVYLGAGNALEAAGVSVEFSAFRHPVYPQRHGDFLEGLSVADALFMNGAETADLVRAGAAFTPSHR